MKLLAGISVLALDLRNVRFGFALFDGPNELLDWGIQNFRPGVNAVKASMSTRLESLLDRWCPDAVVIRAPRTPEAEVHARLVRSIARARRLATRTIAREIVFTTFAGKRNKHEIATAVADRFPELRPRLGRKPKCWEPEPYAMAIFDAAAAGIAHFTRKTKRASSPLPR